MIKERILIIGYGFITSHFIQYSKDKYQFRVLDRNTIKSKSVSESFKCDFINYKDIKDNLLNNIDQVIFALSPYRSTNNPDLDYHNKFILAFDEFLKHCNEYKIKKIILLSSAVVYGTNSRLNIFHEESELDYSNEYAIEKINLEKKIISGLTKTPTQVQILRIANPYGPDLSFKKPKTFINTLIDKYQKKETLEIANGGKTIRDFIFINDVSKYIELTIKYTGKNRIFNISSGIGCSLNKVIKIFNDMNIKPEINILPVIGKDESVLSNQLANELLGIAKNLSIELGSKEYYNYLKKTKSI